MTDYLYVNISRPTKDEVCDLPVPPPAQRLRVLVSAGEPREFPSSYSLVLRVGVSVIDIQQPPASTCPSQLMGTFVMNTTAFRLDGCSSDKHSTTLTCIHSVSEANTTYVLTYGGTNPSFHFVCLPSNSPRRQHHTPQWRRRQTQASPSPSVLLFLW
ncbi:hypothetical protein C0Q70_05510 [Pomacea canaliculata]|uniref:Uncharacterized protein n=1 Tax=Pomacea canaliculata TaxID=400727 RepID=A0A2T7PLH0_POMCA|nr:hypothetical protein C0Q70_05510 [Pomacea canaliculata]